MFKRSFLGIVLIIALVFNFQTADAASSKGTIGVNIVLNTDVTDGMRSPGGVAWLSLALLPPLRARSARFPRIP